MVFAMEYAQVNHQGRGRCDREDYPDVYWRSQHRDMSALRWRTRLTVRPPRTQADIAHFRHLIVAGFARIHDESPLRSAIRSCLGGFRVINCPHCKTDNPDSP